MTAAILLLNGDYRPLRVIPLKRAISLLSKNCVDVVETFHDRLLRSVSTAQPFPAVLRLRYYVNVPQKRAVWSRRAVFARDHYRCSYCGKSLGHNEAELEHIIPKEQCAKQGIRASVWSNTTTACRKCNARKANRTMHDAGLRFFDPNYEPKSPRTSYIVVSGDIPESWRKYIEV